MSVSKPKLTYWDIRGLGEPIRLLLNYAQIDFEDHRLSFGDPAGGAFEVAKDWLGHKYNLGLDFPNLPYYEDGDVKISQSLAILQHLGRKYNLYGDSLKDAATADMVANMLQDFKWQAWLVYNSDNFHEIKEDWKTTIPGRFAEITKFLEGKQFVMGDKISYVDFLLYETVEHFRTFAPDIFEQSPELATVNSFQKRIVALPQIKAYLESGRFKDWPFYGPFVYFGWSKDPDFKPPKLSFINRRANYLLEK